MPDIIFLLGDIAEAHNDNHTRLPNGFRANGWRVTELPHDCLRLDAGRLRFGDHDPAGFNLVWALGFGRQASFFDRMQLLRQVDQRQLVTSVDALMYLHGKYHWLDLMPETHAGNDIQALAAIIKGGGDWVAKPPAGSYGRDVILIRDGDDPIPVLETLTDAQNARYALVQRFIPEIVHGETRTLVAGGKIIGSYLRLPQADLRANLSAQGIPLSTELDQAEVTLVQRLADELLDLGVGFAAVDTAHGYLMEVNIANPGGLATLESLYGEDPTPAVVNAITSRPSPGG
jgi:glutathione synthase